MKKTVLAAEIAGLVAASLVGCGKSGTTSGNGDVNGNITVISREEGSGTRGAFVEITGVEQKNADGKKEDMTTTSAVISNSTNEVITAVSGDNNAIGYISLGSLNDSVKALKVDGVEATAENVANGTYSVQRPFNIATNGEAKGAAADFISYILSTEGQKIIEDNGYIAVAEGEAYTPSDVTGSIVVGGSSSVGPVMEKLVEAYEKVSEVKVELQVTDSSTGMENATSGSYDIGMASREVKDSEKEKGLVPVVIAKDGIAIVVNKNNTVNEITSEQIKNIYTGSVTGWSEVK